MWQGVTQPSAFAEPDVPDKLPVDDAHIVAWFDELEGYPSVGHCLPCPCPCPPTPCRSCRHAGSAAALPTAVSSPMSCPFRPVSPRDSRLGCGRLLCLMTMVHRYCCYQTGRTKRRSAVL